MLEQAMPNCHYCSRFAESILSSISHRNKVEFASEMSFFYYWCYLYSIIPVLPLVTTQALSINDAHGVKFPGFWMGQLCKFNGIVPLKIRSKIKLTV